MLDGGAHPPPRSGEEGPPKAGEGAAAASTRIDVARPDQSPPPDGSGGSPLHHASNGPPPPLRFASQGRVSGEAVHATAVAIAGDALLIFGPSGAGKSRLALALIDASTAACPIRLIGDDRILLAEGPAGLVARAHPRIAGFIERRGLGIVAIPFVTSAPVAAIVELGRTTLPAILTQNLRGTLNVYSVAATAPTSCDAVLAWWRACTTPIAKATQAAPVRAKV